MSTRDLFRALTPLPPWVRAVRISPGCAASNKTLVLCLCDSGHLPEIHADLSLRKYPDDCIFGWGDIGDKVPEGFWIYHEDLVKLR